LKKRNLLQQQYFRRYTTNFKNALNYETYEDYLKHLSEEEEFSQNTTQSEEPNYNSRSLQIAETSIDAFLEPKDIRREY